MKRNQHALIFGCNEYPNFERYTLRGCVNDTKNISSILKQYLGFTDSQMTILTDSEVTKENIMRHLDSLIKKAQDGELDYLYMHDAGHGIQGPDVDGEEEDLKDEMFTTYNLVLDKEGKSFDPRTIIVDDEIGAKFDKIPEKTLVESSWDTCHSYGATRAFSLDQIPRYIPHPSHEMARKLANIEQVHTLTDALKERGMPPNVVTMTGCLAHQTSADAHIENDYHGAFTWNLCNEIRKNNNKLSRFELMKNIRTAMRDRFTQIPTLEGISELQDVPFGQSL